MKILITGSSGFIGFHLANKLLDLGHDVTGIDNHNEYYDSNLKRNRNKISISKNLKFFNMDLDDLWRFQIMTMIWQLILRHRLGLG